MKLREAGVAERCENEEKNRSKEIKMERTKMSTTRVSRMNSASELWCEHELFVGRHTHLACFHAFYGPTYQPSFIRIRTIQKLGENNIKYSKN